jgi:biopolymer transport protein ExbB
MQTKSILIVLLSWLSIPAGSLWAQVNGFGAPPPLPSNSQNNGQFNNGQLSAQPSARIAAVPNTGVPDLSKSSESLLSTSGTGNGAGEAVESIRTSNIISAIKEGGVLMIPIVFCSFVLVVFVFERLLYLRRGRVIPRPFVRGVIEQLEQQQLDQDEAIALCEENGSPVAELFIAALKKWGRPAVEIEQAVVDAGAHIMGQLKKYLRLFNAISNLTPLLGLLGTVLGMIETFNSISTAGAMGRPELLAGGIGTALITTAGGLCVAIPAYSAYVYFLGRADKLILELDAQVSNVIELICAEAQNSRSRSRARKAA